MIEATTAYDEMLSNDRIFAINSQASDDNRMGMLQGHVTPRSPEIFPTCYHMVHRTIPIGATCRFCKSPPPFGLAGSRIRRTAFPRQRD
jgi:hypothetical protein